MTVTEATARRRVARGVALLDGIDPDWRRQLDPDRLEMASGSFYGRGCGCVAAQWHYVRSGRPDTVGRFWIGCELLANRWFTDDVELDAWAVEHGLLAASDGDNTAGEDEEYELLTRLWREAITAGIPRVPA